MADVDEQFGGATTMLRHNPGMVRDAYWHIDNGEWWLCIRQVRFGPRENIKEIRLSPAELKVLWERVVQPGPPGE